MSIRNLKADTNLGHEIRQRHREAQQHLDRGRLADAQQCCLRVLADDPKHADAHFLLGMIAVAGERLTEAVGLLERAIVLDDQHPEYHAQLGRCLVTLRRINEARDAADRAMQLNPASALTLDTVGCVYSRTGDHDRGVVPFRKAVKKQPRNSNFQFNLAASLKFIGDFDGAEAAYEQAAQSTPRYYKAHWALSHLRRQTTESNHTARLEELLVDVGADLQAELRLRNALAK